MKILGIETSFDETAVGVVEDGYRLLSNAVQTSMEQHIPYGGVVPEIAARSHIQSMQPVLEQALAEAKCTWDDIDGIAVTQGAGLGGSLLIGVLTARTLAITKNKPLYAINHVEAHLYANFLTATSLPDRLSDQTGLPGYKLPKSAPQFPFIGLIVSGAHCQLALFRDHFDYKLIGQTQDDAIGEAFDKVAKILGLPYPGGPSLSKLAETGDPHKYKLPVAQLNTLSPGLIELRNEMKTPSASDLDGVQACLTDRQVRQGNYEKRASRTDSTVSESRKQLTPQSAKSISGVASSAGQQTDVIGRRGYDFSFSGPKTAVLRLAQQLAGKDYGFPSFELAELLNDSQKADIAASFQFSAVKTVVDKTIQAVEEFKPRSVVIGGGVASSAELRRQLADRLAHLTDRQIGQALPVEYTDSKLCTDNGAMIATLGCFKAQLKQPPADPYKLDIAPNLSM